MKTKDAILQVLSGRAAPSKYALAKAIGVRPIMVSHYLTGSRMKQGTADKFQEIFGIEITDVYSPTQDALARMKTDGMG